MTEYIDRDKLFHDIAHYDDRGTSSSFSSGMMMSNLIVLEQPVADVVEVVRCRDCKSSFVDDKGRRWCENLSVEPELVKNDDYCSYGERKEEQK